MMRQLLVLVICVSVGRMTWAEDATLTWSNGDSLNGTLIDADANVMTWQSSLFSDPLKIGLTSLASVKFAKSESSERDEQCFRILMKNGDVLFGNITAISEKTMTFQDARFGTFELARDQLLSLQRSKNAGGVIYSGPRGLDGWQPAFRRSPDENNRQARNAIRFAVPLGEAAQAEEAVPSTKALVWTEEPDGSLSTIRPDAALFLPQSLPDKFEIEVELHSKKMLSFVLAIGRDAKAGLRLESWIDVLVAANGTKFATLQQISNKEQTLHVHLFVDYAAAKMFVYSASGQKLGEVATTGLRGGAEGVMLRNGEWDLSLRRLRISNWDGTEPKFVEGRETRIQLADGTIHFGAIQEFNSDSGIVNISKENESVDLPLPDIVSIVITSTGNDEVVPRGATQLSWEDGGFISGALASIADGRALIKTSYSESPLQCNFAGAVRLGLTPSVVDASQSDRLFHEGGSLQGSLVVDGEADAPIRWKPLGGINASTLKNGGDAKFVRGSAVTHFSDQPEMLSNFPDVIYLKNNDVLPCRIEACTEETVQLSLPFSEVKSFARTDVRAVELSATGRIHQKGFSAPGWKGLNAKKTDGEKVTLKGNTNFSHPSILTGDTVRFHLKWSLQSYANLTISLFSSEARDDDDATRVAITLMQANLHVLDRAPQQDQMFFRGFGGQNAEEIIRAPKGEVDIQIVARDGNLLVSVDGKQVKTIKLNPAGAGSKGLAFNANVTMMGNVVINGRVQQSEKEGVEVSAFEIDNLSGASIRQFIEEEVRQVALTIPRFRRDNPPTHVLIAANGDLLRGRMLAISQNDVLFESRLEKLRVGRDRVAAIVWLDPAAKDSGIKPKKPEDGEAEKESNTAAGEKSGIAAKESSEPEDSENGFVMGDEDDSSMQAQLADGFSITMTPAKLVNGQIKGHSKLLGDCTFPAATIRELFLGDPKNRETAAAYERWISKNAQEPDWDIAAGDGGNSAGSAMIGTVAEDFELPLLDGSRFRLKDHADKIIVLDFWATWCGPCIAALPDYIAATSEFDSSKVIFVAVNQQEASDQIRGFLTERKLSPIVALDRNGEIGQKFQVSGIPHTVILGPGNVIEDVHVGYQQGGGESMQIAIQQLLDGTWKRPASQPGSEAPREEETDAI